MSSHQLFFSFLPNIGQESETFESIVKETGDKVKKICEIHGHTEFKYSSKYKKKLICIKCDSIRKSKRKKTNRQEILKLHGGKCSNCSYSKCDSALQFHHIDPSNKKFRISYSAFSLEKIILEASKCVLLCANCHAEVEHKISKNKLELYYSKKELEEFYLS